MRDDVDREKWSDWLRRTFETYNWRLHAWVLMRISTGKVAEALGYRSPSSVTRAVARVESSNEKLRRTATQLEKALH